MSGSCTLLLQSSSGKLGVGFGRDGALIHDSSGDEELARSRDIRRAIGIGLQACGLTLADFGRIYVDIGPGGLGATRTSVAFANATGFAAGLPVIGVPAFELLGFHAARITGLPVAIARRAARPNLFFGLFEQGQLREFRYTHRDEAAQAIAGLGPDIALAGNVPFSRDGAELAPIANAAPMQDMLDLVTRSDHATRTDARALPITETL